MIAHKIGYLVNRNVSYRVVSNILRAFPNSYLYIINPSFDLLEQVHKALLKDAQSIGP